MKLDILNVLGKNFKGGQIKLIQRKRSFFFLSGEFLISFDIFKRKLKSFDFGLKSMIVTFDIQETGKLGVILSEKGQIVLFNFEIKKIIGKITFKNQCLKTKWSPVENFFATLTGNMVQIWKIPLGVTKNFLEFFLTYTFNSNCTDIWDFDWDRSGKILIAVGADSTIRIFRLNKKKKSTISTFLKHGEEINLVKFGMERGEFWILTRKNILKKLKFLVKDRTNKFNYLKTRNTFSVLSAYKLKNEVGLLSTSKLELYSKSVIQGYNNGMLVIFEIPLNEENFSDKIYNPKLLSPIRRFDFFKIEISSLTASKDLNIILIGSYKNRKIFILNKLKPITLISNKDKIGKFTSICLSYNDKLICTGNSNGILQIWSMNLGISLLFFRNHSKKISKTIFLKKTSRFVLTFSMDGTIKLFDLKKLIIVRTMENMEYFDNFEFFDVNYSNKLVISSGADKNDIFIWSLKTGHLKEILKNTSFEISSLHFLEKRNKIISNNKTGIFKVWMLDFFQKNSLKISCKTIHINTNVLALAFNPLFKEMVFFSNFMQIVILNNNTFKIIGKLTCNSRIFTQTHFKHSTLNRKSLIGYSSDGKYILITTNQKSILLLRENIKIPGTYQQKKDLNVSEKLKINFSPDYLKKGPDIEKNYIVDFKCFNASKNWLFLFPESIIITGSGNFISLNKRFYPPKICGKKKIFLVRIIQKLLLEKNFKLVKFLFYYFPKNIKLILSLILLTNSVIKQFI